MFRFMCPPRHWVVVLAILALSACGGGGGGSNGTDGNVSASSGNAALTYRSHTRDIIDSRCVTCHREGGQAPFSLATYAEVVAKRSAIVYTLESGTMPKPGFAPLSAPERTLLLDWLAEGAAEGEGDVTLAATPYTYYGYTKSILDARCANCHSPGEIAPFSLTDYEGVYAVRSAIAHQVESDAMPPWPPTNDYTPLRNNRSLPDEERAVLLDWLAGGAPAGDPSAFTAAPVPAAQVDYNLRVQINEPYTPTQYPDEYRCLLIDWPLEETVFVDAVTVVPDAKAQVHHVFAVIADPDVLPVIEAADGADGKPGFPCLGAPSPEGALLPPRTLSVWAPGITGGFLPEGTGVRVEPGSKIIMQMHYNTINSAPMPDQSSLDIHYVSEVEREAVTIFFLDLDWYPSGGMPIPAGDPNVTVQYTGNFDWPMRFVGAEDAGVIAEEPFALHSAFMHQHVLGKAQSIELIREDGTEIMLVDIRDWDFDWQDEYFFEEEIIVYPGDQFRLTCTWDNSPEKQQFIDGKQIEPRYTEFGEGTTDEMCVNYFYVTRANEADLGEKKQLPSTVAFHQPRHHEVYHPGDYVPIEVLTNAFKLQEPQGDHASHGHEEHMGNAMHNHRAGHYHVYLNAEDDEAEHLTRWEHSTFYKLPDDLPPGQHTFRVSLRSDAHEALGIEDRVTIRVVEPDPSAEPTSLIDVEAWRPASTNSDLFTERMPPVVNCPSNSWYEEDGALEVQTGYCNYLTAAQPSLAAVEKGDLIRVVLWHGQLRFEEPAEAHVAIALGGEVLWQDDIEIPSGAGVYDIVVPSTVNAPEGAQVQFHLDNHGFNTWTLLSLEVESQP